MLYLIDNITLYDTVVPDFSGHYVSRTFVSNTEHTIAITGRLHATFARLAMGYTDGDYTTYVRLDKDIMFNDKKNSYSSLLEKCGYNTLLIRQRFLNHCII